jgi:hypothetical protein
LKSHNSLEGCNARGGRQASAEDSVVQQKSAKPTDATKLCRMLFMEVLLVLIAWQTKQAPLFLSLHDAAGVAEVLWDRALFQPPTEDMPSAACLLSHLTEMDAAGSESSWASIMR